MPFKNITPKEGFDAKTFLYIRTNPLDNGDTPLNPSLAGWISPDLNIISNPTDTGIAIKGVNNQVEVIVTNAGGIQVNDAFVDCFIADPTTAFTPFNASLIGSSYIDIPSYSTNNTIYNWIPTMEGHHCLLARASLIIPSDTYSNNLIFDVTGDRHIAMRNLHIISLTAESRAFGFLTANPLGNDVEIELEFKIEDLKFLEKSNVKLKKQLKFSESKEIQMNFFLGQEYNKEKRKEFLFGLTDKSDSIKLVEKKQSLKLKAFQSFYSKIEFNRTEVKNKEEYSIINIIQRDKKSNKIIGGLMVLVNG
jgi:hypothetical protein